MYQDNRAEQAIPSHGLRTAAPSQVGVYRAEGLTADLWFLCPCKQLLFLDSVKSLQMQLLIYESLSGGSDNGQHDMETFSERSQDLS